MMKKIISILAKQWGLSGRRIIERLTQLPPEGVKNE